MLLFLSSGVGDFYSRVQVILLHLYLFAFLKTYIYFDLYVFIPVYKVEFSPHLKKYFKDPQVKCGDPKM